jgi:hypothetical protein
MNLADIAAEPLKRDEVSEGPCGRMFVGVVNKPAWMRRCLPGRSVSNHGARRRSLPHLSFATRPTGFAFEETPGVLAEVSVSRHWLLIPRP